MYAYIGSYMSSLKSITVGSGNSAYASDNGVLTNAKKALSGASVQKLTLSGDAVKVKIFIWNDDMSPYAKIPETVVVK